MKNGCSFSREDINVNVIIKIYSHETSARAWCTWKTQRDWVEREAGGGSGWGIHVNPWLIHVNV